jgi:hypothetical protein
MTPKFLTQSVREVSCILLAMGGIRSELLSRLHSCQLGYTLRRTGAGAERRTACGQLSELIDMMLVMLTGGY